MDESNEISAAAHAGALLEGLKLGRKQSLFRALAAIAAKNGGRIEIPFAGIVESLDYENVRTFADLKRRLVVFQFGSESPSAAEVADAINRMEEQERGISRLEILLWLACVALATLGAYLHAHNNTPLAVICGLLAMASGIWANLEANPRLGSRYPEDEE